MRFSRSNPAGLGLLAISVTLGLALGACFDPTRPAILNCSSEGQCPSSMVCEPDNVCRSVGDNSDARPQAVDGSVDIDAVPVECSSDGDCASPPDLCYKVGTCNTDINLCVFPKVSCPANETCKTHACNPATGECWNTNANEGATCGDPSCISMGSCNYDTSNECDETGTQSQTCTEFVCTSGACVGSDTVVNGDCSRVTLDNDCNGGTTCDDFANCIYSGGVCGNNGSKTRTCTDRTCKNEACEAVEREDSEACTRNTDGNTCDFDECGGGGIGIQEICCSNQLCNDVCGICDQF